MQCSHLLNSTFFLHLPSFNKPLSWMLKPEPLYTSLTGTYYLCCHVTPALQKTSEISRMIIFSRLVHPLRAKTFPSMTRARVQSERDSRLLVLVESVMESSEALVSQASSPADRQKIIASLLMHFTCFSHL